MFLCFQIKYKQAGKQQAEVSLFSKLPETLDTKHAKEASKLQSQVPERTVLAHPAKYSSLNCAPAQCGALVSLCFCPDR